MTRLITPKVTPLIDLQTEIKVMNLPTEESKGRRCLVLDIDYTLFDHHWYEVVKEEFKSDTSIIPEFKRPYLHEFLVRSIVITHPHI